jgi:tRNA threonylcarbamoyladenosine biosynthesis protein TsaE
MSTSWRIESHSVADTERVAQALARHLPRSPAAFVLHLQGDLGAGKTVLARALLQALGVSGPIKSPSYTLLEPYRLGTRICLHLDLYRVRDPSEVEALALRDYLEPDTVWLIEWPERALEELPPADLSIQIEYGVQQRVIDVRAMSQAGAAVLAARATEARPEEH